MAYEQPAEQEISRLSTLRRGPGGDRKGVESWGDEVLNDARAWVEEQSGPAREQAVKYYNILEGDILRAQQQGVESREEFQQWQIHTYHIREQVEAMEQQLQRAQGMVDEDDDFHGEGDIGDPFGGDQILSDVEVKDLGWRRRNG